MLLDERYVGHRDCLVVSLRLSVVGREVSDRAANPIQRPDEVGLLKIQVYRAHMGHVSELAFRQRAALQRAKKLLVCHDFSLRR
jgi:hypothetical protein